MPEPVTPELCKARFAALAERYSAEGPDSTVPHATKGPTTFATLSQRDGRYFLNYVQDLAAAEQLLAREVQDDGSLPVAVFDLAELDGEEPPIFEGDVVAYEGENYYVSYTTEDTAEGAMFQWLHLNKEPDRFGVDDYAHRVDQFEVTLVERAEPDTRLPVRYDVARTVVQVVLNTQPTRGWDR